MDFERQQADKIQQTVSKQEMWLMATIIRQCNGNVSAPLVGAGEVGDERAGGARHVRLQGELLGGRALVLPGEGLQPDAVVGEGFCNLNEDRLE